MRLFDQLFITKSFVHGAINCWLQYVLAQPVDIDVRVVLIFGFQYLGVYKLIRWIEPIKSIISWPFGFQLEESLALEKA